MRQELIESRTAKTLLEKELEESYLQLDTITQARGVNSVSNHFDPHAVRLRLSADLQSKLKHIKHQEKQSDELRQLRKENVSLRKCVLHLQSELFGSKLATKYLDKELAGRIQQIQLLGRDLKGSDHDRLWHQLGELNLLIKLFISFLFINIRSRNSLASPQDCRSSMSRTFCSWQSARAFWP